MNYIGFRLNVTTSLWPSPREASLPSPSKSKDPTSLCTAVTLKRRTICIRTSRVRVSTHSRNSTDPKSPWRNGLLSRSSSPCSTFLDFLLGLSWINDWVVSGIIFALEATGLRACNAAFCDTEARTNQLNSNRASKRCRSRVNHPGGKALRFLGLWNILCV